MTLPSERDEGQDYEGDRLRDHRFGDVVQDPGVEVVQCNAEASGRAEKAGFAGPDGCHKIQERKS